MPTASEDEAAARACGQALLDASKLYEGLLVRRYSGLLLRRATPLHAGPTAGFVARQRRFLAAAYLLADSAHSLEAETLLRGIFEFLVCQEWVALDPKRNLALLVQDDQRWKTRWVRGVEGMIPGFEKDARSRLTPDRRDAMERYEAALPTVLANVANEIGDAEPTELPKLYDRAKAAGLEFLYRTSYRNGSHLSHPSIYAIDALSVEAQKGLRICASPPLEREPQGVYVRGAILLHEALTHAGKQWGALQIDAVDEIGAQLFDIQKRRLDCTVPGWRELFPPELVPSGLRG